MNPTLDDLLEELRQVQKDISYFPVWEHHMFIDEAEAEWDVMLNREADLMSAIDKLEQLELNNYPTYDYFSFHNFDKRFTGDD